MSLLRKLGPLVVASVAIVGFSATADAYQCRTKNETVVVPDPNQGTALATAHAAWTASVKSKYGLPWSVWSIAAQPVQSCSPAGSGYQCMVRARPCLYVVP
jgi:hypothetical protein